MGTALFGRAMVVSSGAVELPRMLSDHAVLPQGVVVPVWGLGSPGDSVTVTSNGKKIAVERDKDGVLGFKTEAGASYAISL